EVRGPLLVRQAVRPGDERASFEVVRARVRRDDHLPKRGKLFVRCSEAPSKAAQVVGRLGLEASGQRWAAAVDVAPRTHNRNAAEECGQRDGPQDGVQCRTQRAEKRVEET